MELTRTFSAGQYAAGLESWQWLDLAGDLGRPWQTPDEMWAELDTPEGRDRYLLASAVDELERRGRRRGVRLRSSVLR